MRAQPSGFELEFTQPVDRATASRPDSYIGSSYTYIYQQKYGSPEIDPQPVTVNEAVVSEDGRFVQLRCTGLRERYVHELSVPGIRSPAGTPIANPTAYYTLNRLPAAGLMPTNSRESRE